jgi:hypothetical protein
MVEYEDGSMKGIEFSQLSPSTCLELSQKGLCPPPAEKPEALKHYLLLLWKNGWQEVIGVDKNSLELLRYYILERIEEVGRLALEVKGEYPLLFTIGRLPKELQRIVIVGKEGTKGYSLEPKMKKEEGDKIEHIEFDKAERHFQSDPDQKAESWYGELVHSLRAELEKRGLNPEEILTREPMERIREYGELARALKIRATEKQQDVYGLIQLLMEKLAALKTGSH